MFDPKVSSVVLLFNTLRPNQNACHLAAGICKLTLWMEISQYRFQFDTIS